MMRDTLIGVAAVGGVVAAFLHSGIAAATPDTTAPSPTGPDAFTIYGTTFDPFTSTGGVETEGFTTLDALSTNPPLLTVAGGLSVIGSAAATQSFEVYANDSTDLGSVATAETVANLYGIPSTEFTVTAVDQVSGTGAAGLPAVGTVYDVLNYGAGFENVYEAVPGGAVTDKLVTPLGALPLGFLFGSFNAADQVDPGKAVAGLEGHTTAGDSDAFAIAGTTFDPFTVAGASETPGFAPITPSTLMPPLLTTAGGMLGFPGFNTAYAPQDFTVYEGTGADAQVSGFIYAGMNVTNSLFGMPNTEFTVFGGVPVSGSDGSTIPAVGTVYDVLNLGLGFENVYEAVPGGSVTDNLVTPLGTIPLGFLYGGFNAADPMNPGAALGALPGSSVGADAFVLDGMTFDPFTDANEEGYDTLIAYPNMISAPPLLTTGGGMESIFPGMPSSIINQQFDVYDGATQLGVVSTDENLLNLLGIYHGTGLTVTSVTPVDGVDASQLPAVGTVYDVLNLGLGFENVYEAVPGGSVTDNLVTPLGALPLSFLFNFNAADPLDPGGALTGLGVGDGLLASI